MADYSKAISQVEQIHNLESDLDCKILSLEILRDKMKNEWRGPASEEFQNRLSKIISDIQKTKQSMSDVSNAMERAAKNLR
ncbi:MAG: WXG100 family type VII secretion target [Clostridia bacterium]|nr:WXG100 family type VII secretion target [Clostridia bacterium]